MLVAQRGGQSRQRLARGGHPLAQPGEQSVVIVPTEDMRRLVPRDPHRVALVEPPAFRLVAALRRVEWNV
jgi:hypothetical protein